MSSIACQIVTNVMLSNTSFAPAPHHKDIFLLLEKHVFLSIVLKVLFKHFLQDSVNILGWFGPPYALICSICRVHEVNPDVVMGVVDMLFRNIAVDSRWAVKDFNPWS